MPTCHNRGDFQGRPFIYIHVPKTAGVSLTSVLEPISEPYENDLELRATILRHSYDLLGRYQGILFWHITYEDLERHYGVRTMREHFSFAFIRNPWDWLVSMYAFIRDNRDHPESMITGHMTFENFVDFFLAKRVSQFDFVRSGDRLGVDRLYRFEDLEDAIADIARELQTSLTPLPRLNVSSRGDYREYYTDELAERVGKAFARDVALGEYTF